jgi:signal transduction histidine kinase
VTSSPVGPVLEPVIAGSYEAAMLNILEDGAQEQERLWDTQRAVINILEDSSADAKRLTDTVAASMNILGDLRDERAVSTEVQLAMLNILDDFSDERQHLSDTQRATLNILDDFGLEKIKAERAVRDLAREVGERQLVEQDLEAANLALSQSNEQLGSFSYSVAHDLRAPLRAIDGFSMILLEDHAADLDEEGQRLLGVVLASVAKMGSLIDGLLSFSRLGRAAFTPEKVDMTAVVQTVVTELREIDPLCPVELVVEPLAPAWADRALIRQVWVNLLSNAIKFSRDRASPRVVVRCDRRVGEVAYSVADNGAGFDMQFVAKLFKVFERLHTTAQFDGTGIGLAIVDRIVGRHGGWVSAEGKVGEGATFSFSLPVDEERR